ncbi:MAG: DUF3833 family protein [Hyphomicrobiales bacterium]
MMLKAVEGPVFVERDFHFPDYFEGSSEASGFFEDRSGRIKRRFVAQVEGYWQDDVFVLDEVFTFCDGERDHRTWMLKFADDRTFAADCIDVHAPANGHHSQNTAHLTYAFKLRRKGKTYNVDFCDTFTKLDDDTVINRAIMSKWGITLGHVTIVFNKIQKQQKAA